MAQQRDIKFRVWDNINKAMDPIVYKAGEQFGHPSSSDWFAMQYTGLKDVNGREIYEGDIVEANGLLPSAVIFYESAFRTEEAAEPLADDAERYDGFTVIGNIYETPNQ